jgi:SAM-dependent methyltransferase
MGTYVQYGAGFTAADGWLNFDASPTLRIQKLPMAGRVLVRLSGNAERFPDAIRYGDVVKGLPLAADSVDGLYASHVLEHLALADARAALAESLRVLRPGGVFRLVVPDLKARARAYVEAGDDPEAAHRFLRSTYLGCESRGRSLVGRLRAALGNSAHRWMFDFASMSAELERAGFVDIRRAAYGDAADPMFARVESEDRFVDQGIVEVAIEARKPPRAAGPGARAGAQAGTGRH